MRDEAVGRVRRLADDFESRGDFATEADLRTLLAAHDALTEWKETEQRNIVAATVALLNTGLVPEDAKSVLDGINALTAEVAALRADRDRLGERHGRTVRKLKVYRRQMRGQQRALESMHKMQERLILLAYTTRRAALDAAREAR